MTIIEAIKSGKRFKRPVHKNYHIVGAYGCIEHSSYGQTTTTLLVEDILADDWEVETIKKELSAEDIITALDDAQIVVGRHSTPYSSFVEHVLKSLGL